MDLSLLAAAASAVLPASSAATLPPLPLPAAAIPSPGRLHVRCDQMLLLCVTDAGASKSHLLLCLPPGGAVRRKKSCTRSTEFAHAARICLARRATSQTRRFATAAICDTNEDCPSYANVRLALLLLLVLLLLLLLALPALRRLQCCCHHQECTTPRATHAPLHLWTVLMQRKASPR